MAAHGSRNLPSNCTSSNDRFHEILKNWESEKLKFCRPTPPLLRNFPGARGTPTRLATPGFQVVSFSGRFTFGIPTPMPGQTAPLRADLEQVGRGAELQVFSFFSFRERRSEPP
jgi:hypothetical protein